MKTHLPIVARRFPAGRPHEQRGVALIITLLLLAVITFMAIAFLVLSYGQKNSTATGTDQEIARQAAAAAADRAVTDLLAPMMATGNEFNFDLRVSTNFINTNGFFTGNSAPTNVAYNYFNGNPLTLADAQQNLANLLYSPRAPVIITNRLTRTNEFRYYLDVNRNGLFDPTGWQPVTNYLGQPRLDANQQPIYTYVTGDPQWIGVLEFPDKPHSADNFFVSRFAYLVLPVGNTLDVNYIHNYAKVPDTSGRMLSGVGDGFFRNMGAGTYEINLAAFLVDLNTNIWLPATVPNPYLYRWEDNPAKDYLQPNRGVAFDDALSLISYRYNWTTQTLASASALFGPSGVKAFGGDFVDDYAAGPPMLGTFWPGNPLDIDQGRLGRCWSGADNTNHFFSVQDLFDRSKVRHNPADSALTFADRLAMTGTNVDTYNRTTFFRLLSQLGTDSAPEPDTTINLNYDNKVQRNVQGIASATNFYPWKPVDFFSNAANAMLAQAGYRITVTNIQIYPTNFYSPSVHRILQLALNIYDATTNRPAITGNAVVTASNGFPTVLRPIFRRGVNGQIFIAGYREIIDGSIYVDANQAPPLADLETGTNLNFIPSYKAAPDINITPDRQEPLISGYPMIIGARKGFPNFNQFEMQTEVQVTRKLEFWRKPGDPSVQPVVETNQMYLLTLSNMFGIEAWNSYTNAYPRDLQMFVAGSLTAELTNVGTANTGVPLRFTNGVVFGKTLPTINANTWAGFDDRAIQYAKYSFRAPFYPATNHFYFLNSASYSFLTNGFCVPYRTNFDRNLPNPFDFPRWALRLKTRMRFILYDWNAKRIVDYVNLDSKDQPVNITSALADGAVVRYPYQADAFYGSMFATNAIDGSTNNNGRVPTFGILNQIGTGLGTNNSRLVWNSVNSAFPAGWDRAGAINFFRTNLLKLPPLGGQFDNPLYLTNHFACPYQPTRYAYIYTSWQANDPLVHYTVGDLTPLIRTNQYELDNPVSSSVYNVGGIDPASGRLTPMPIGSTTVNPRYEPWGYRYADDASPTKYTLQVKDPMLTRSDDYDFPTNKFPNVGWLGRIHRGTPWQTVYLKSPPIDFINWAKWSGNGQVVTNFGQIDTRLVALSNWVYDAAFTFPTNDWKLLDVFSTGFNDNSTLGKLSVNQSGLAAWSAVLSGVIVMTNTTTEADFAAYPYITPQFAATNIWPAGYYDTTLTNVGLPPVARIVTAINNVRATNNGTRHVFDHLGDILAVPELTVASPFLNTTGPNVVRRGLNDAAYERMPQQILGLLKCDHTPRFVIYAYGQALKPADRSVLTSGKFVGMCTNYQIMAEVATRTVVRIENAPNKPHAVIESFNILPPD